MILVEYKITVSVALPITDAEADALLDRLQGIDTDLQEIGAKARERLQGEAVVVVDA